MPAVIEPLQVGRHMIPQFFAALLMLSASNTTGWLHVNGRHIQNAQQQTWHGRGANIQDTRSCGACTTRPDPEEVKRRIDVLVDDWHANFIRLTLETPQGKGSSVLTDAQYVQDLQDIVAHIGSKPGVYVEISLWLDPTLDNNGWPTDATAAVLRKWVELFRDSPQVIFGICNEPKYNADGRLDAQVWTAMNNTVAQIRAEEALYGAHQHLIAVQGTGSWCRRLDYYVTHPITAGGGGNILYEVHIYDPKKALTDMLDTPAQKLPLVVSEFGPVSSSGTMSLADCDDLMALAEKLEVPYAAWTFHMRCPPNLIEDNSHGGCGIGMEIKPTAWGALLKKRLSSKY